MERYRYLDRAGRDLCKEVVRHPGAITVIPVEADGRILMVEVGRLAVGRFLLEFCAGKLEPGEDPSNAARRELEEEVGRRAGTVEPLGNYYTSPGFCDERMHAFIARDLQVIPQRLEPGEEIRVVTCSMEEIDRKILEGSIDDGKSIAAWHLFKSRRQPGEDR